MRGWSWQQMVLLFLLFSCATVENVIAQTPDGVTITDTTGQSVFLTAEPLRSPRTWDERTLFAINAIGKNDLPALDFTMKSITYSIYPLSILMPAGLYAGGWLNDDRMTAIAGVDMALSEMLSGLTTVAIKSIVQRPRPYQTLRDIRLPTGGERGFSFPSGHSTAAWAMTTSLMLSYREWYVIVPATLYSTLVSLSRPYVGVHYPSDVIVGAFIGAGSAFIIHALEPSIVKGIPSIFPKQKSGRTIEVLRIPVLHITF